MFGGQYCLVGSLMFSKTLTMNYTKFGIVMRALTSGEEETPM